MTIFPRAARSLLAAVACSAVAAALPTAFAAPGEVDRQAEAARIAFENEMLRKKVDLASGGAFYLVLDRPALTLSLMLKGAVLARYTVLGIEVGEATVAFVPREAPSEWEGRLWEGGNLVPPRERDRMEIKAPTPGDEPAPDKDAAIPPTPEEAVPVPPRYGVRFQGGLFVEIASGEATSAGMGDRLRGWWEDVRDVLRSDTAHEIRLRVTLGPEDAQAIYRSLPPDTKLLVIPPR